MAIITLKTLHLRQYARIFAWLFLVYLATRLGDTWMLSSGNVALFWPSNAILLAALILLDPRSRIVCFTLSIPVSLAAELSFGYSLVSALLFTTANCVEVAIAFVVVVKMTNPPHDFISLRNLQVMFFAIIIATMIGGVIGVAVYWDSSYLMSWRKWALGDLMVFLVLTPFILTSHEWPKWFQTADPGARLEFLTLFGVMTLILLERSGSEIQICCSSPLLKSYVLAS